MMRRRRLKNRVVFRAIIGVGVTALFTILLLVSGCSLKPERNAPDAGEDSFSPPTLAPTPMPTSTPTEPPDVATKTPACTDELTYISDVTIPDGMAVAAGSTLDKRWEVKNSGTCNWDEKYHIRWIGGSKIGGEIEQELAPARSGTTVNIRMALTAPTEKGKYRSAWQAVNPQDKLFGDPFYIEFVVQAPTP
jgi:hypothetical protein